MNYQRVSPWVSLATAGILAILSAPANAASVSFSPFSFKTNWTGSSPKGNVMLQSVNYGGNSHSNFGLVSGANLLYNDLRTVKGTGAASSDMGDNATVGIRQEVATNSSIVASLGNLNLNSIIDTEDKGRFVMDLFFTQASDRFLFWERGMNSKMLVEALDDTGSVLSSYLFNSNNSQYAGFGIDTKETTDTQKVGSQGLLLNGATSKRLRLTASGAVSNGPDFKVVSTPVPEPATIVGTLLAAGAALSARRKKQQATEAEA